jgi:prepilin-type N-terminal cleavage/methylation domain-containing protein
MPRAERRGGFTLIEVLVAVAIVGLVTAGGFRLIALSLRTLAEVRIEQDLVNEAQKVYLDFLTKEDMPDSGEKDGVQWDVETDSVPVIGDLELTFRKLIVEYRDREMVLYLPETEIKE